MAEFYAYLDPAVVLSQQIALGNQTWTSVPRTIERVDRSNGRFAEALAAMREPIKYPEPSRNERRGSKVIYLLPPPVTVPVLTAAA